MARDGGVGDSTVWICRFFFFFSSRRRHTRCGRDWSSDVCSSDLVHDDEGVNVQIYNRCVGTRYCQNNCPYKVRRFNFFDHWKSYDTTMNLAWNPDVTVRTRGIMEKCTFCVQRIREAKDLAKTRGELVRDGDLKT